MENVKYIANDTFEIINKPDNYICYLHRFIEPILMGIGNGKQISLVDLNIGDDNKINEKYNYIKIVLNEFEIKPYYLISLWIIFKFLDIKTNELYPDYSDELKNIFSNSLDGYICYKNDTCDTDKDTNKRIIVDNSINSSINNRLQEILHIFIYYIAYISEKNSIGNNGGHTFNVTNYVSDNFIEIEKNTSKIYEDKSCYILFGGPNHYINIVRHSDNNYYILDNQFKSYGLTDYSLLNITNTDFIVEIKNIDIKRLKETKSITYNHPTKPYSIHGGNYDNNITPQLINHLDNHALITSLYILYSIEPFYRYIMSEVEFKNNNYYINGIKYSDSSIIDIIKVYCYNIFNYINKDNIQQNIITTLSNLNEKYSKLIKNYSELIKNIADLIKLILKLLQFYNDTDNSILNNTYKLIKYNEIDDDITTNYTPISYIIKDSDNNYYPVLSNYNNILSNQYIQDNKQEQINQDDLLLFTDKYIKLNKNNIDNNNITINNFIYTIDYILYIRNDTPLISDTYKQFKQPYISNQLSIEQTKIWNIYHNELQINLFEIFFGHFIRPEQYKLIKEMYNELINNPQQTYTIQNMIMGAGKSSVLTPILTMLLDIAGKPFILVLPEHLLKDAVDSLLQYRPLYTRNLIYMQGLNNINNLIIDPRFNYVLSDTQFKYWIIQMNKININIRPDIVLQQFYLLFDEIDSILDPIKSNFNKIETKNSITNYINKIKPQLYQCYLNKLKEVYANNTEILQNITNQTINEDLQFYDNDIINSYKFLNTLQYNQNYGFSTIPSHNSEYLGVPYSALNTPIKNSYFSSIQNIIIATIFCYIYNYIDIRQIDIINYCDKTTNKFIINKTIDNVSKNPRYNLIKAYRNILIIKFTDKKQNLYTYFNYIIEDIIKKNLLQTIEYVNATSVDIISKNISHYKSAYSGTVNFDLPLYYNIKSDVLDNHIINSNEELLENIDNIYEFNRINENQLVKQNIYSALYDININKDEHNEINLANNKPLHILFLYNSNTNKLISNLEVINREILNNKDILTINGNKIKINPESPMDADDDGIKKCKIDISIIKLCGYNNRYSALIDAGALLKNLSLNETVKLLYTYTKKKVIYIDNDDNKWIYDNGNITKYNNESGDYFYYYDNKHIVGSDLKQPINMHGLITLSYLNSYTNIAQAAFRLRKMGKTHTLDYIIETFDEFNKIEQLGNVNLDKLIKNDENEYTKLNKLINNTSEFNTLKEEPKFNILLNITSNDTNEIIKQIKQNYIKITQEQPEKYNYQNEFISKLKEIIKDNKGNIKQLHFIILKHLIKNDIVFKKDKLSYLFNQNVLYYYKLINNNSFKLTNNKNQFIYIQHKNNNIIYSTDDSINNIFFYSPYINNGIKEFIVKEHNDTVDIFKYYKTNTFDFLKENYIMKKLLSTTLYKSIEELYKNSKNNIINQDISTDESKEKSKEKSKQQEQNNNYNDVPKNKLEFNTITLNTTISFNVFIKSKDINLYYQSSNNNIILKLCVLCKYEDKDKKYFNIELMQFLIQQSYDFMDKKYNLITLNEITDDNDDMYFKYLYMLMNCMNIDENFKQKILLHLIKYIDKINIDKINMDKYTELVTIIYILYIQYTSIFNFDDDEIGNENTVNQFIQANIDYISNNKSKKIILFNSDRTYENFMNELSLIDKEKENIVNNINNSIKLNILDYKNYTKSSIDYLIEKYLENN